MGRTEGTGNAIDKARFERINNDAILEVDSDWKITIRAYETAIAEEYRLFSYGDYMLILCRRRSFHANESLSTEEALK